MSNYLPPEIVTKVLSYITYPPDGESWWQTWYGDTHEEEYYDVLEILRKEHVKKNGDYCVERGLTCLGKRRRWQERKQLVHNNFGDQHIDVAIEETDLLLAKLIRHLKYINNRMFDLWTMPEDTPLLTQIEMKDKVIDTYNMINGFWHTIPKKLRLQ